MQMKSFLLALLLSVLFLSNVFNEVSGKELECYYMFLGDRLSTFVTCTGNDVACISAVYKDSQVAFLKQCGEREELQSMCNDTIAGMANSECKDPCDTNLCNNELP